MVAEDVTDGKRIAELLASEITGSARDGLAAVAVVDADPDAVPTPGGSLAYRIDLDGAGTAGVAMFPDHARVQLSEGTWVDVSERADLTLVDEVTLRVDRGAAVKAAADALAAKRSSATGR